MKALKFCFVLFGLFFMSNGTLKAQFIDIGGINITNIFTFQNLSAGVQTISITVESPLSNKLAISLHNFGDSDVLGPVIELNPFDIQQTYRLTTKYTFQVQLPFGEQAYLTCGYIDNSGTYEASDGGCIIGVEP